MALPAPLVPDLTSENWIDLDLLGNQDLSTTIFYPGMQVGDTVFVNWRGCRINGESADYADLTFQVSEPTGEPVPIGNALVRSLDQGWVFYSYFLPDTNNPLLPGEQSLRLFFYVGKRDLPVTSPGLGVAQFRESHEQTIIVDWITTSVASVVVPPYQAMADSDQLALRVEFYDRNGVEDDVVTTRKTLVAEDIGRPVVFTVNKSYLRDIVGGFVLVSYSIVYAQPTRTTQSPVQRLDVAQSSTGSRLPAPVIKDFSGDSLEPVAEGIVVQFAAWAGAQAGDVLLMYVDNEELERRIEVLRLDLSSVDSQVLEVHLDYAWMLANNGQQVSLYWQYARVGSADSSEPLELLVRKPLELPAPIVEEATAEDPAPDGRLRGYLYANRYIAKDIYVTIPDDANYGPNDNPQMHWDGHGSTGNVIITQPTPGNLKRFQVPSRAIPANMDKRLDVYYQVTPTPGRPVSSERFDLQIRPMTSGWPAIQLTDPPRSQPVSLAQVPAGGAQFRLDSWPFMAEGQPVRIAAEGRTRASALAEHVMRNDEPVTAAENAAGELLATLPKPFLTGLARPGDFTVKVRASFDDGQNWTSFLSISLQLVD